MFIEITAVHYVNSVVTYEKTLINISNIIHVFSRKNDNYIIIVLIEGESFMVKESYDEVKAMLMK